MRSGKSVTGGQRKKQRCISQTTPEAYLIRRVRDAHIEVGQICLDKVANQDVEFPLLWSASGAISERSESLRCTI